MKLDARWRLQPLSDVVDILDSQRVPVKASDRAKLGGSIPYYGATGQAGTINRAIFNEPLVLLGEDGAPFFDLAKPKAYLIDGPAWVNNHAHVLRTGQDLDRSFLKHYLDAFDYRGFANGTTRLKLTQGAMRRIPVPTPKLSEQRRIVEILEDHLSHLDAGLSSAAAAEARARAMVMSAQTRLLQRAAEGGSNTTIGELAKVGTGTTPSRARKDFYDGGTVPWITSGDLSQGVISSPTQWVTDRALSETSLKLYPVGSLVLAMYGEGKTRGTVAELALPATTNQACAVLQVNDEDLRPWVRAALDANYDAMRRMAAGGVQPNLNLGLVRAISIPIPDAVTRDRLLAELYSVRDSATKLCLDIARVRSRSAPLRRAVLAAAFEGKLTGRHTDNEVIEELADV